MPTHNFVVKMDYYRKIENAPAFPAGICSRYVFMPFPRWRASNGIGRPGPPRWPRTRALIRSADAETRSDAQASFDAFIETYELKYEKAADCLKRDRDALLAYYDFPAEHWKHLRTSNPIESTFATVRGIG